MKAALTMETNGFSRIVAAAFNPKGDSPVEKALWVLEKLIESAQELVNDQTRLEEFIGGFGTWPGDVEVTS